MAKRRIATQVLAAIDAQGPARVSALTVEAKPREQRGWWEWSEVKSAVEWLFWSGLVTAAHRDKVSGYVEKGVSEGAKLVLDGRNFKVASHPNGFYIGPSLFDHVKTDMVIYRDEIFGPVLIVLRVNTLDEAIALVNANPYGNGTAIFTASGEAARRYEQEIQVGMVGVNVPIPVPASFFSFGGWKQSLFGDHHAYGDEALRFYTRYKSVMQRWPEGPDRGPEFSLPVN